MGFEATIRRAEARDEAAILRLTRQFAMSYTIDEAAFARNFPALLAQPGAVVLVGESADEVVAYVVGFALPTLFANGPILELTELAVEVERRRRGIGSALIEEVLRIALATGCVEIVVPTRRAGPFYETLGFARTADYYKKPLHR